MMDVAIERLMQGESSRILSKTNTATHTNYHLAAFGWRLILSSQREPQHDRHDQGTAGS